MLGKFLKAGVLTRYGGDTGLSGDEIAGVLTPSPDQLPK